MKSERSPDSKFLQMKWNPKTKEALKCTKGIFTSICSSFCVGFFLTTGIYVHNVQKRIEKCKIFLEKDDFKTVNPVNFLSKNVFKMDLIIGKLSEKIPALEHILHTEHSSQGDKC